MTKPKEKRTIEEDREFIDRWIVILNTLLKSKNPFAATIWDLLEACDRLAEGKILHLSENKDETSANESETKTE